MTEKKAKEVAERLKRPGEEYAIEKTNGHCQRCNQQLLTKLAASGVLEKSTLCREVK